MAIIRYEPLSLLNQFQKPWSLLNQLQKELECSLSTAEWAPAVDIKEEDNRFVIHADIPGVKPEDIEVSMDAGVLTIKGEKSSEEKTEKEGYKRVERTQGSFYRSFSLPNAAEFEAITAKSKHGVLEVIVPKREAVLPKRITVTPEES